MVEYRKELLGRYEKFVARKKACENLLSKSCTPFFYRGQRGNSVTVETVPNLNDEEYRLLLEMIARAVGNNTPTFKAWIETTLKDTIQTLQESIQKVRGQLNEGGQPWQL